MSDVETARVAQNPRFQELVHERTRFGWVLTGIMLVIYFGFIGLIAFDKALLAGVLILGHIVGSYDLDHVLANPPYFVEGAHSPSPDAARGAARGEDTPLSIWLDIAARRLRPGGYFHMIQRIDRLPEALANCRLGSVEVLPLGPRIGRDPGLFILRARKGGRAAFRLRAPLILHKGATHARDGEDYTDEILSVLRGNAPLKWADCRGV